MGKREVPALPGVDPSCQIYPATLGAAPARGRMAGRRVLVVGAGQQAIDDPDPPVGNGRAISRLLGREGAAMACLDISPKAAAEVCTEIAAEGGRAVPIVADIADIAAIDRAVEESAAGLGGLDGLVLNAGITSVMLADLTPEHWDRVFAINLRSQVWFAKRALEIMDPGSSVLLVTSLAGFRPAARQPAYGTSKAAQMELAREIAMEGESQGIRCNSLAVGVVDTPLGRLEGRKRANRSTRVPFGRQGTAWEVAHAALFLMSHEASYVNAQCLCVDGGLLFGIARDASPG
jgi:NAD(P)-dependent dehydrogenase (short-subunit alcohol dehydrogenase family)